MPGRVLTARNVRTLKPRRGRTRDVYFDQAKGAPAGFALRVSSTGARAFYLIYGRGAESRKVKLRLGDAAAMSLADARERARTQRDLLEKGLDPRAEQEREERERDLLAESARREEAAQAARPTLAALVERFTDAHARKYRAKTLAEYRRIARAYIAKDPLGNLQASAVRRYQLRALLETLARDAPIMANRVQQLIRAAYAWGLREQLDDDLEANPAAGFEVHDERPLPTEERTLSDEEAKALWLALDATTEDGVRKVPAAAAAYLRLLLLCGLRRTEAALATWRDVDLKGEWRIPAVNRKAAGRRGKAADQRELIVPLSRKATAILKDLEQLTGPVGPVFGAVGHTVRVNPHRFMTRIRGATGVNFTLHDLRATCATGAANAGAAPHVVSLILGHAVLPGAAQATRLYDRALRLREVRTALERWAEHVEDLIASDRRSSVVRLEGR